MITFLWYIERMQIMMEMQNFNLDNANLIVFGKAKCGLGKKDTRNE